LFKSAKSPCRHGEDVWVDPAAQIRASEARRQKPDRRAAPLILKLLPEARSPRIWTPSGPQKDPQQLLIYRYKLARMRAQLKTLRQVWR
jgi:hypothetical protein